MTIKKDTWVQIRDTVLTPEMRAPQVPDDTKKVPLLMWVKGYLNHDVQIGEVCEITTVTGRVVKGILEDVEPAYTHGFGAYVPELDTIRRQVKDILGY